MIAVCENGPLDDMLAQSTQIFELRVGSSVHQIRKNLLLVRQRFGALRRDYLWRSFGCGIDWGRARNPVVGMEECRNVVLHTVYWDDSVSTPAVRRRFIDEGSRY